MAIVLSRKGGGSGSGSGSQLFEVLSGNSVLVADGDSEYLTWDTHLSGSTLLDRSDPVNPAVIESGVYAVEIEVTASDAMTVGGFFLLYLSMDDLGEGWNFKNYSPIASAILNQPVLSLAMTFFVPAGGIITTKVQNFDGVSAIHFDLTQATVQRVS